MKWPTLLLLSATSLAASGALTWIAVQPTGIGARDEDGAFPAAAAAELAQRSPDPSPFRAGRTLMMESRLGHRPLRAEAERKRPRARDVAAANAIWRTSSQTATR